MNITLMFLMVGAITDRSLSEQERQFALKLYNDYYPLIRGKVCKLIQNPNDRDDLVHNCYLRLLTYIDRLIDLEQPQLIRYIERVVLTCYNEFCASNPTTVDFEEVAAGFTADESQNTADFLEQKELYENFHKQFHQLSYHEQRVLYLRYVEELSLKEISEKLHIQKSSVNTLLCRIRKKARKLISEQMDEGGNQNE